MTQHGAAPCVVQSRH